jgi:16S rRNA (adenine1518-N6/adenine1519-N6)-dimethyltransferase
MTEFRDPDALIARAKAGDPRRDQHFLIDERVLDRLPGYLADPAGHVLEIGAGTGALTDRLLRTSERVTAIERDPELVGFLRSEFATAIADGRLTVIEGDALEVSLPEVDATVSNLPYGASSELLFRILPLRIPAVVTVQREFAERMAAPSDTPEYGRLSVTTQHYAEVTIVEEVPPTAFSPQPAVQSAVVRLDPREPDYEVPEALFFDMVRAVFTQRRKTLRNAIRNTTHISGLGDPEAVVDEIGEPLMNRRPGELSPAELASLTRIAADLGDPP